MNNRGYITILVSLFVIILLAVFTAVYSITDRSMARVKAVTALSSACSSIKAEWYNRYIFDHYHILLIDMDCGGVGTDHMTEEISELLSFDLPEGFTVEEVGLSEWTGVLDNDCRAFKDQIKEYFLYGVADAAVDELVEKTNGKDKPVDDSVIDKMDREISDTGEETELPEGDTSGGGATPAGVKDPRKDVRKYKRRGVTGLIKPKDAEFSGYNIEFSVLPSGGRQSGEPFEISSDFFSYSEMKKDINKGAGWSDGLKVNTEALLYAGRVFNNLTDSVNDDTVLGLEMEYIIAGGATDGDNYEKVTRQIIAMRFASDFAYIVTDAEKMLSLDTLAGQLTILIPPLKPAVKYLLAGCWSYVEGVTDTYLLLRGHKVPYFKSRETWISDMSSLSKLASIESGYSDDEGGMSYKDYLMILMSLHMDTAYLRMLDLMQINAVHAEGGDASFRMQNAGTEFSIYANIRYGESLFKLQYEDGY